MRSFITCFIAVVALCAANAADARKHHRAAKQAEPAATKAGVIPVETKRHPADIALDRKIKGICRGC